MQTRLGAVSLSSTLPKLDARGVAGDEELQHSFAVMISDGQAELPLLARSAESDEVAHDSIHGL